jgi:malonyl CoA-acyl carrier protein transacylase
MPLTSIAKELPFAVQVTDIFVYSSGQKVDNPTFEVQFRDSEGQLYSLALSEPAMRQIGKAHYRQCTRR